jgi:hypothetical protein
MARYQSQCITHLGRNYSLYLPQGPQKQGVDLEANLQGTDNYVSPLSSG